jgi:hypothetical protein
MSFLSKTRKHYKVTANAAAPTWLKQGEVEVILSNLEEVEQKFEDHLHSLKKDSRSDQNALKWTDNVLGSLRDLISLIADKK